MKNDWWFFGIAGEVAKAFYGATEDELTMILYDNYELAMMRGEAFNFWNPEIYWNNGI